MTPGEHAGSDESPWQAGRAWQHPSEVGLANRGRADRKRSTLIAGGVLLGGVGLLLSGVFMGSTQESVSATSSTLPLERAELSVAHVMPDGDSTHAVTGVVLDDRGHVMVDAAAVDGVERVWVRCSGGGGGTAVVTGRDPRTDVAVLRLDKPAGVPASVGSSVPAAGTELRVVNAGRPADQGTTLSVTDAEQRWSPIARAISLSSATAPERFDADLDGPPAPDALGRVDHQLSGAMVFDRAGQLAGMVSADRPDGSVQVLAASDMVQAAQSLIADAGR